MSSIGWLFMECELTVSLLLLGRRKRVRQKDMDI
jgi:hypothetical protein